MDWPRSEPSLCNETPETNPITTWAMARPCTVTLSVHSRKNTIAAVSDCTTWKQNQTIVFSLTRTKVTRFDHWIRTFIVVTIQNVISLRNIFNNFFHHNFIHRTNIKHVKFIQDSNFHICYTLDLIVDSSIVLRAMNMNRSANIRGEEKE